MTNLSLRAILPLPNPKMTKMVFATVMSLLASISHAEGVRFLAENFPQ